MWKHQFLSAERLKISEEVAYKKIIECNTVNKLRGLGMYLYRVRCNGIRRLLTMQTEWKTIGGTSVKE
jgi:hypothetical protein